MKLLTLLGEHVRQVVLLAGGQVVLLEDLSCNPPPPNDGVEHVIVHEIV